MYVPDAHVFGSLKKRNEKKANQKFNFGRISLEPDPVRFAFRPRSAPNESNGEFHCGRYYRSLTSEITQV